MQALSSSDCLHNLFLDWFPEMSWSNMSNYSITLWRQEHAVQGDWQRSHCPCVITRIGSWHNNNFFLQKLTLQNSTSLAVHPKPFAASCNRLLLLHSFNFIPNSLCWGICEALLPARPEHVRAYVKEPTGVHLCFCGFAFLSVAFGLLDVERSRLCCSWDRPGSPLLSLFPPLTSLSPPILPSVFITCPIAPKVARGERCQ